MKRRTFLQTAIAAAAAPITAVSAAPAAARVAEAPAVRRGPLHASDSLNLGVIGPGSRGQYLMQQFLRVPDVRFGAICDVYGPRFAEARAITGEDTPTFDDYRRMLDAARDLDAVVLATPLGLHALHGSSVLAAGHNLYSEKSLALDIAGCQTLKRAAEASGKVFQIGLQYRYAGWYQEAVRIIREGYIGKVTHIYAYWHRNYNWRRDLPDPSLERLINWRLYRELSGGLLAELGSHHIDTANWIFDAYPEKAVGNGGIAFYPDGRETFDHVQAILRYPGERAVFFSSIIGNHRTGFQIQVYGTGGTIELTLEDGTVFYEPARPQSAVPEDLSDRNRVASSSLATRGDMPYRGPGLKIEAPPESAGDPGLRACEAFVESVRTGKRPLADIEVGWRSGIAVASAIEAVRTGEPVDVAQRLAEG